MTIEKAIESLSLLRIFDAPSLNEAVKMAVIALRTQADTPPNDPLTLEQLQEMDGEPVWVECLNNEDLSGFAIVDLCFNGIPTKYFYAYFDYYGDDWLAYRRKPEEA